MKYSLLTDTVYHVIMQNVIIIFVVNMMDDILYVNKSLTSFYANFKQMSINPEKKDLTIKKFFFNVTCN